MLAEPRRSRMMMSRGTSTWQVLAFIALVAVLHPSGAPSGFEGRGGWTLMLRSGSSSVWRGVASADLTFSPSTHEVFGTILSGKCGESLKLTNERLRVRESSYASYNSSITVSKADVVHRKWLQRIFFVSSGTSGLEFKRKFQIEWHWQETKNLSTRLVNATQIGEKVQWHIYTGESATPIVVNGTWRLDSNASMNPADYESTSNSTASVSEYSAWGSPGANFTSDDYSYQLDGRRTDDESDPGTIDFFGVGYFASRPGRESSQCETSYRQGSRQVIGSKDVLTVMFVENLANITDCELSDWGEFSNCSASCGGGTKTRNRTIVVKPTLGGLECGSLTQTRKCNTEACVPEAVENATCIATSSHQVLVEYSQPSGNGHPVRGYTIKGREGTGSIRLFVADTGSNSSSYTISNLLPVTEYRFMVAAFNSQGTGDYSSLCPTVLTLNGTSAYFSDTGVQVFVRYSHELVNAGVDINTDDCDLAKWFEPKDIANNIFGTGAFCRYQGEYHLDIDLGANSVVVPGYNLTVVLDNFTTSSIARENVTVRQPESVNAVVASVVAPNVVSHCSSWEVDASASTGPGGLAIPFKTAVSIVSWVGNDSVATAWSSRGIRTTIEPHELSGLSVAEFVVNVSNPAFGVSANSTVIVMLEDEPLPSVTFTSSFLLRMHAFSRKRLRAYSYLPSCYINASGETSDAHATYNWTVVNSTATLLPEGVTEINQTSYSLDPLTTRNGKYLNLEPFALQPGAYYLIAISRTSSVYVPDTTPFSLLEVFVEDSEPQPIIQGGHLRTVSRFETDLRLDAFMSYDPAVCEAFAGNCYDELRLEWECHFDAGAGEECPVFETVNDTTASLNVSAAWNGTNEQQLLVTLIATSYETGLTGYEEIIVVMIDSPLSSMPVPSLGDIPARVNHNDALYVTGECSNSDEPPAFRVLSFTLDINEKYRKTNSTAFIVPADVFQEQARYAVRLTCGDAYAQTSLTLNTAPAGGVFLATRAVVLAFEQTVDFIALRWTDEVTDLPLQYRFEMVFNTSSFNMTVPLNIDPSSNKLLNVYIPPDDEASFPVILTVQDVYGAAESRTRNFSTVAPHGWSTSEVSAFAIDELDYLEDVVNVVGAIGYYFFVKADQLERSEFNTTSLMKELAELFVADVQLRNLGSVGIAHYLFDAYLLTPVLKLTETAFNGGPIGEYADTVTSLIEAMPLQDFSETLCAQILTIVDALDGFIAKAAQIALVERTLESTCGQGLFIWEEREPIAFFELESEDGETASVIYRAAPKNQSVTLDGPAGSGMTLYVPSELLMSGDESFDHVDVSITQLGSLGDNVTIEMNTDWYDVTVLDAALPNFATCNNWPGEDSNATCYIETTERTVENMTDNVTLLMPLTEHTNADDVACVWLNETSSTESTSGCRFVRLSDSNDYVVCACDHLTAFAAATFLEPTPPCGWVQNYEQWEAVYESWWYRLSKFAFMLGYLGVLCMAVVAFRSHHMREKRISESVVTYGLFVLIALIRCAYYLCLFFFDIDETCMETVDFRNTNNHLLLAIFAMRDTTPPLLLAGFAGIYTFWLDLHELSRQTSRKDMAMVTTWKRKMIYGVFVCNAVYAGVNVCYMTILCMYLVNEQSSFVESGDDIMAATNATAFGGLALLEAIVFLYFTMKLQKARAGYGKMKRLDFLMKISSLQLLVMGGMLLALAGNNAFAEEDPWMQVALLNVGFHFLELLMNFNLTTALYIKRRNSPTAYHKRLELLKKRRAAEREAQDDAEKSKYEYDLSLKELEELEQDEQRKATMTGIDALENTGGGYSQTQHAGKRLRARPRKGKPGAKKLNARDLLFDSKNKNKLISKKPPVSTEEVEVWRGKDDLPPPPPPPPAPPDASQTGQSGHNPMTGNTAPNTEGTAGTVTEDVPGPPASPPPSPPGSSSPPGSEASFAMNDESEEARAARLHRKKRKQKKLKKAVRRQEEKATGAAVSRLAAIRALRDGNIAAAEAAVAEPPPPPPDVDPSLIRRPPEHEVELQQTFSRMRSDHQRAISEVEGGWQSSDTALKMQKLRAMRQGIAADGALARMSSKKPQTTL